MTRKLSDEEVAARFSSAGLEPLEPYVNSHTPRLCRCLQCGSTVRARLTWFSQSRGACNVCAYKKRSQSLKKYTSAMAEAKLREMGFEPLEPYPGRKNDPWKARCVTCGHEATPLVKTLENGHGCRMCSADSAGAERRLLGSAKARAEMIAAGAEPLEAFPGSHNPWRCRCLTCGSEIWPRLGGIRSGQGACKICGSQRRADKRRFSHEKAASLMLAAGFEVQEPYVNADAPWTSICLTCGNLAGPRFSAVTSQGRGGCFECGRRKLAESKMLDDQAAEALMRASLLEPLEPYPGSAQPWRCRCLRCEREVSPRHHGVLKGQGGCKFCAPVGLDRTAPGVLYLIRHDGFQALKIGVTSTSSKKDRVGTHADFGWEEVRKWELSNAGIAEAVETLVLSMWRKDLGAPPALSPQDMPQGGYSETVAMIWVDESDAVTHAQRAISAVLDTPL